MSPSLSSEIHPAPESTRLELVPHVLHKVKSGADVLRVRMEVPGTVRLGAAGGRNGNGRKSGRKRRFGARFRGNLL